MSEKKNTPGKNKYEENHNKLVVVFWQLTELMHFSCLDGACNVTMNFKCDVLCCLSVSDSVLRKRGLKYVEQYAATLHRDSEYHDNIFYSTKNDKFVM